MHTDPCCMMDEKFYDWTKKEIWDVIRPTIPEGTGVDTTKVRDEFYKLSGTNFKKRILDESESDDLAGNNWSKYIKPALKSLQKEKYRRFNDPIHGTIELHPLLCKIIDTPEFHRLNDIKQLGGVHYVYPNARHTRFEHSIGVCYLAGEFARALQKKQPELNITDKEILCVEIAGLIHDLGHGPFSHMFEYGVYEQLKLEYPREFLKPAGAGQAAIKQLSAEPGQSSDQPDEKPSPSKKQRTDSVDETLKWEHEKLSQKLFEDKIYESLKSEFEKYGITKEPDIDFITELILYKKENITRKDRAFLYQIVANKYCGIDVDKWDYFARDGHFIGVAHDFDFKRLMSMSRVIWVESEKLWMICFRTKEMNNIYGMFRTRCSLFQRALHHKAKIAAELMLCRAIALAAKAIKLTCKDGESHKHYSILDAVSNAQKYIDGVSSGSLDGFIALTDSIIYAINVADPTKFDSQIEAQKVQVAQKLLTRLAKRDFFHEVQLKQIQLPKAIDTDPKLMKRTTDELQRVLDDNVDLKRLSGGNRSVFVQLVDYKYGSEPVKPWTATEGAEASAKTSNKVLESKSTKKEPDKPAAKEAEAMPSGTRVMVSASTQTDDAFKENDPVRAVYFYEKGTPTKALSYELATKMEEPTVSLVRPEEFSVFQWKVYSDLPKEPDIVKKIIEVIEDFVRQQTDMPNLKLIK